MNRRKILDYVWSMGVAFGVGKTDIQSDLVKTQAEVELDKLELTPKEIEKIFDKWGQGNEAIPKTLGFRRKLATAIHQAGREKREGQEWGV